MSFLAVDSQKMLFVLQRNQLQFEQTCISQQSVSITREKSLLADTRKDELKEGETWDPETDSEYLELQAIEEYLESRKDSLDSEIQLLDQEISSLKSMVNNNIKNGCALNLLGG